MSKHVFTYFNEIFPTMWNKPALSDYEGDVSYTYCQLAEQIERLCILFKQLGIKPGDKIALCGRNSSNWAVSYLAIAAYGGVIVSILQDFTPDDIRKLINHSDAKLLMVGPYVWRDLESTPEQIQAQTPELEGIIKISDFSVIYNKNGNDVSFETANQEFTQKYPQGMTGKDIHYRDDNYDDLMLINYTSGSTGAPKGVMLTYRSLSGNIHCGHTYLPNKPGFKIVSMLPLAHAFGQLADFLLPLSGGCHIYFLAKSPTPSLLLKAYADVHPYMIATVPMVIEKICKRSVFPITNKAILKRLWRAPLGIGAAVRRKVKSKLMKAFGGHLKYFIVGGAALNPEVEKLLLDIHFPLVVGYGMTECGPLIGGAYVKEFVARSSGHILPYNEVKIDSSDPYNEVGEILVKGEHIMLGYYKNPDDTAAVFTEDGWMKTGDLGVIDQKQNIFIKGRNKNMILGNNGQNIYPEEIEDKLNNMDGVAESVVVKRGGKLVALVFPDLQGELRFDKTLKEKLQETMNENLRKLNELLPKYSQINDIEIQEKEFEKTPKKSIKRFLYSGDNQS